MSIQYDTFTKTSDTPLESHTSDSGIGYDTEVTADFDDTRFIVDAATDEVRLEFNSYFRVIGLETLLSSDYYVEVTGKTGAATTTDTIRAIFRGDKVTGNWYEGGIRGDGAWYLVRYSSGEPSTLSNGTVSGFSASQYYKLEISGVGERIKFYIDDIEVASVSNDNVTLHGNIGFMMQGLSARITLLDSNYLPSKTGISIPIYDCDMLNAGGMM